MAAPRVLIFETGHIGHHLNYVQCLARAVLEIQLDVTIAITSDARASSQYEPLLADLESRATIDSTMNVLSRSRWEIARDRTRYFLEMVRKHRPERIYIPSADGIGQLMSLRRPFSGDPLKGIPVEGAFHRASFAYKTRGLGRITSVFSKQMLKRCRWERLFQVDLIGYEWIKARGGGWADRTDLLPDPVYLAEMPDAREARAFFNIAEDAWVAGCVGSIVAVKGMVELLRAFSEIADPGRRAASCRRPVLLLVGRQDATVRDMLASPDFATLVKTGQIIVRDAFVSFSEMHTALRAMDLVAIPYFNHVGISSILLRAVAASRPILGSSDGWIGRMIQKFKLGMTCDPGDHASLVEALRTANGRPPEFAPSPQISALLRFHSPKNTAATWTSAMRRAMGLPQSPDILAWEDVVGN